MSPGGRGDVAGVVLCCSKLRISQSGLRAGDDDDDDGGAGSAALVTTGGDGLEE